MRRIGRGGVTGPKDAIDSTHLSDIKQATQHSKAIQSHAGKWDRETHD